MSEVKTNLISPVNPAGNVDIPSLEIDGSRPTVSVTSRTALAAVDTDVPTVYLNEGGRSGTFAWRSGDYSTEVAADTEQGIYVASASVAATVGCWVRQFDGGKYVEWFGAVLDGIADDYTPVQACLNTQGLVCALSGQIRLGTQLVIKANTYFKIGRDVPVLRSWAGTNGSRPNNATIKNENALLSSELLIDPGPPTISTWDEGICIEGGMWGHYNDDPATYRGTHIGLIGVRGGGLYNVTFETQRSEWCTQLWVENFEVDSPTCNVAEDGSDVSNDFVHIVGGKNISITSPKGGCDDDFVVIGSNYNLPVDGVTINNIACDTNANAFRIAQNRIGATAAFGAPTEKIKNVTVNGIAGNCGKKRTGYIDIGIQGHTEYDLIENVSIDGVQLTLGNTVDASNVIGIDMVGAVDVSLSNILLETPLRTPLTASNIAGLKLMNFVVKDAPSKSGEGGIELDTCSGVVLNQCYPKESATSSLNASDCDIQIVGGEYPCGVNGAGGIQLSGTVDANIVNAKTVTTDSATTDVGVSVAGGSTISRLIINGLDATESSIPVKLRQEPATGKCVVSDVLADSVLTLNSGGVAEWDGKDVVKIASYVASSSDSMNDITNVPAGKGIVLVPNDFTNEPITVVHDGTRFILSGSVDYVMNTASSAVGLLCISPGVYVEQWRV